MTDGAFLNDDRGPVLLTLARAAIASTLGQELQADQSAPWLRAHGACFVTLTRDGNLRGCIGGLEARRPLLEEVTTFARAAAFDDPRFPPLSASELASVRIEVSLLTALEPVPARSEVEAHRLVRPHVDGIVMEWRQRRGTFLPQVWEKLPSPEDFFENLKLKTGLPRDFWSEEIRLFRYQVVKWSEAEITEAAP
jgi:AmmeMemoRadiSam system protein A